MLQVQYDVMDVAAKQFDEDFFAFKALIKELERRLGAIIVQAFDDCTTLAATFKLLDSFEGLLEREVRFSTAASAGTCCCWQHHVRSEADTHLLHHPAVILQVS